MTKTLRGKLFLSVSLLFLLVAVLSYFLPNFLVKRDLNEAGSFLKKRINETEERLLKVSSHLIQKQFFQSAEELQTVTKLVETNALSRELPPWNFAIKIASYDPQIGIVQVTQNKKTYLLTIEDAVSYKPLFGVAEDQTFAYIPQLNKTYLVDRGFLYEKSPEKKLHFKVPSQQPDTDWVEKIKLVQALSANQQADGILGGTYTAFLTEQLFFEKAAITSFQPSPFLMERNGKLDFVSTFKIDQREVAIGISFSQEITDLARLLNKPIIAQGIGFLPDGKTFTPPPLSKEISYEGETYLPYTIDLKKLDIAVLVPKSEVTSTDRFLETLKEKLITKISLNLILASLLCLLLALFVLNRIAKKISSPIKVLADASNRIGQGYYEGIVLPSDPKTKEVETLTNSFKNMITALIDREKVRGVLSKVVSKEIAEEILEKGVDLGGKESEVTLFFSDIRGFTHLSENIDPKVLIEMLNAYMTRMCKIIDATRGVVDKFVGDEIMALYGVPLPLENASSHALKAALLMKEEMKIWNEERKAKNEITFEMGIGIHRGVVLSGNMGAENRLNYTVIGANVNLASRICAKALPLQILVSEATYNQPDVQENFLFKELPPVTLKGIEHEVKLFELISRK